MCQAQDGVPGSGACVNLRRVCQAQEGVWAQDGV